MLSTVAAVSHMCSEVLRVADENPNSIVDDMTKKSLMDIVEYCHSLTGPMEERRNILRSLTHSLRTGTPRRW